MTFPRVGSYANLLAQTNMLYLIKNILCKPLLELLLPNLPLNCPTLLCINWNDSCVTQLRHGAISLCQYIPIYSLFSFTKFCLLKKVSFENFNICTQKMNYCQSYQGTKGVAFVLSLFSTKWSTLLVTTYELWMMRMNSESFI